MNLGMILIWIIAFIISCVVFGVAVIIIAKIIKTVEKMFKEENKQNTENFDK